MLFIRDRDVPGVYDRPSRMPATDDDVRRHNRVVDTDKNRMHWGNKNEKTS